MCLPFIDINMTKHILGFSSVSVCVFRGVHAHAQTRLHET